MRLPDPAPEEAERYAQACLEAGRKLRGRNLGLGAWREIARFIFQHGGPEADGVRPVVHELAHAESRIDVSRVLERVRRYRPTRRRSQRSARPSRDPVVHFDFVPPGWDDDEAEDPVAEWVAEMLALAPAQPDRPRWLPAAFDQVRRQTPIGEVVARFDSGRHIVPRGGPPEPGTVGWSMVFGNGADAAHPSVLASILGLHEDHPLLELASGSRSPADHIEMAALTLLADRFGLGQLLQIEWALVAETLADRLGGGVRDDAIVVIAASAALLSISPQEHRARVLEIVGSQGSPWGPVAALSRSAHRTESKVRRVAVADLAYLAGRSRLVSQILCQGVADSGDPAVGSAFTDGRWSHGHGALALGAGTIRRLDYPSFALVDRPGVTADPSSDAAREVGRCALQLLERATRWTRFGTGLDVAVAIEEVVARDGWPPFGPALRGRLAEGLGALMDGYHRLRWRAGRTGRIRRADLRRAGSELLPGGSGSSSIAERAAAALVASLNDLWELPNGSVGTLKEPMIAVLREIALSYFLAEPRVVDGLDEPEDLCAALAHGGAGVTELELAVSILSEAVFQSPRELQHALGIPPDQPLPLLKGGRRSAMEQRARRALKALGRGPTTPTDPGARQYRLIPLSKRAALGRGDLAGDCSSREVPLRALTPHTTFYGLFEGDERRRGYLSVFEAWAFPVFGGALGQPIPVLTLETINLPNGELNGALPDLLFLLAEIARSRGLLGLATSLNPTTWNYGTNLAISRLAAWRNGVHVGLRPADPIQWALYDRVTREGAWYSNLDPWPLGAEWSSPDEGSPIRSHSDTARLLAPIDPEEDAILPANRAEASRLSEGPRHRLKTTAVTKDGRRIGFISDWPTVRD